MVFKPIENKFMENNYLFALGFKEGYVFGRVVSKRYVRYKPWYLIDSNGTAVDISASSHQGELRFRDPRNTDNDILYLKNNINNGFPWFLHGSFGIKPHWIRMYLRMPEAREIPGRFPELDPVNPANPDNLGYMTGMESPYENPTDFVELTIPPKIHISSEYYNLDSQRIHKPAINIDFCIYWFQALNPSVHSNLIAKIANREIKADLYTIGIGETPLSYAADLQREWGVTTITLDEAAKLGSRRY